MSDNQLEDYGLDHKYINKLTEMFKTDARVLKKCTASNCINYYKSWDTNLCEFQR